MLENSSPSPASTTNENRNMYRYMLIYTLVLLALFSIFQLNFTTSYIRVYNSRSDANSSRIESVILQRKLILQQQCSAFGYSMQTLEDLTAEQMEHMIVDKEHKFLYCYVPKVACTNWKRMLMLLTGLWNKSDDPMNIPSSLVHTSNLFQKFSSLSADERAAVLTDYTRLLVVRHPFERLLSAYRNKFELNISPSAPFFHHRFGTTIIKNFRRNATKHSLENGDDVTFSEFVQYLLTPAVSLNPKTLTYNEHWDPMARLCAPCIMNYNVLGKYETIAEDSNLALHTIGAEKYQFPDNPQRSKTLDLMRSYYDTLPMSVIRRLYRVYIDDFRLFDYNLEEFLHAGLNKLQSVD